MHSVTKKTRKSGFEVVYGLFKVESVIKRLSESNSLVIQFKRHNQGVIPLACFVTVAMLRKQRAVPYVIDFCGIKESIVW